MAVDDRWPSPIQIVLVQHRRLDCLGIASLISRSTKLDLLDCSTDLQGFVALSDRHRPDVAMVDVRFPSRASFEAAAGLRQSGVVASVMFLDDEVCLANANRALQVSRSGYYSKLASFAEIEAALVQLQQGETAFDPRLQHEPPRDGNSSARLRRIDSSILAGLTDRELDVMRLLALGYPARQVATQLHLTESAVENLALRIRRKLGVSNVSQLTRVAMQQGLID
ncbi:MAG: response regulator transcription factor [Planctomycetota bacterium]